MLLALCLRLPPDFSGTVVDTALRAPLPNTKIVIHFADSTEDSMVTIGFNEYLSLIGNSSCQKFNGTLLTTVTDSLGRFAFRLLPRGHFTVSVQSPGYEIGQFKEQISGTGPLQSRYVLRPSNVSFHGSIDAITVYGQRFFVRKDIEIAEEEKHTGFSPFLSNVVQAKAEIRRVPEGPSMMLVRSGCPYDNVYVVAGVSMPAPFHFGGYPYADIDGLMISALSTIKVTINDIAAKRIDASGCIVEADPGKITFDNDSAGKGFFLKGDISYSGFDFLAAYSSKTKADDFMQIGYSVSNDYALKANYRFYSSVSQGNQGLGIPQSYGNATLTGSKSFGPLRCTAFGWLAWDSYNSLKTTSEAGQQIRDSIIFYDLGGKALLPWGMGSVKVTADSSNLSLTLADARRQSPAGYSRPYEWDLPWTIRTSLHLCSKNGFFHLYVDYIRSKGLPYYDFEDRAYAALPVYRSIDLNFQLHSGLPSNRYLNKMNCYMTLKNAQDLLTVSNVRDYYWDSYGHRQPVYLGYARFDIGARFGIKL